MYMCRSTKVYGFGTSKEFGNGHYYEVSKGVVFENVGHNYSIEHQLIRHMSQNLQPARLSETRALKPWLFPEPLRLSKEIVEQHRKFCNSLYYDGILMKKFKCGSLSMETKNAIEEIDLPGADDDDNEDDDEMIIGERGLKREKMIEKLQEMKPNQIIRNAKKDDIRFWRDIEPHSNWLTERKKTL
eukprot:CAMPEP_0168590156 /NCGR_PEP_ID=MMETSP0420-20121227/6406_1 /TAXON_ID=498008 /ORGANISM="Pessonella sp." /LENGTH=185 /DNA_ID=CAMNT_0008625773 /DNA_START=491 /DNA_END=1048 /DNA_ORIENTATION=+